MGIQASRHRRTLVLGPLLVVLATTAGAQPRLVQPERDPALAAAVNDFLAQWLIQRNPARAIESHLSPRLNDARLIPAGAFSLDEYLEFFGGERMLQARAVGQADVQRRMTAYLQNQLPPDARFAQLDQPFMPFSIDDVKQLDPELWNIVGERGVRALPGLPALAYAVRSWNDLSWTSSAVGFRLLLPQRIDVDRVDTQGVVLRLRGPIEPYTPPEWMFLLWVADEKFAGWKFLGLTFPPTN